MPPTSLIRLTGLSYRPGESCDTLPARIGAPARACCSRCGQHGDPDPVPCCQNGQWNVRYRNDVKRAGAQRLTELVAANASWLRIRYAF